MNTLHRFLFLLICVVALCQAPLGYANAVEVFPGRIYHTEIFIPGPQRRAIPLDERAPLLMRIRNITPQGDGNLYHVAYTVMEAGQYNLQDYLVLGNSTDATTSEGSTTITADNSLPEDFDGRLQAMTESRINQIAWYKPVALSTAALWVCGLIWIIAALYRKRRQQYIPPPVKISPWKILQECLSQNDLQQDWRLLETRFITTASHMAADTPVDQLFSVIFADPQAGPLLAQLEAALHQPGAAIDLIAWRDQLHTLCLQRQNEEGTL